MTDMIATAARCLTLALAVPSVLLTDVRDPSFSQVHFGAHLHNLTCASVSVDGAAATFTPTLSAVHLRGAASVSCVTEFDYASYSGHMHFDIDVSPSLAAVESTVARADGEEKCTATASVTGECEVDVQVHKLYLDPPNAFLNFILKQMRHSIEEEGEKYVCGVQAPRYAELLMNKTLDVPEAITWDPADNLTRVEDSPLYRGIATLVGRTGFNLDARYPIGGQLTTTLPQDKTLNFTVDVNAATADSSSSSGRGLDSDSNLESDSSGTFQIFPSIPNILLELFLQRHIVLNVSIAAPSFSGVVKQLSGYVSIPENCSADFSMDVLLRQFQCDDTPTNMFRCHVPRNGGFGLLNVRLAPSAASHDSDFLQVFTNLLAPSLIVPALQAAVDSLLSPPDSDDASTEGSDGLFLIPAPAPFAVRITPPRAAIFSYITTTMAVVYLLMGRGCYKLGSREAHADGAGTEDVRAPGTVIEAGGGPSPAPALNNEEAHGAQSAAAPMSGAVEDALLIAAVMLCAGAFAWSNGTTAARVIIGGEIPFYAFSLLQTVAALWGAGLRVLSVAVFLFSCVYPYVKLASILFFTVVLHRPESAVLRVIDYIGKYSFIDTFVMLIMVSGMSVEGVARVEMLPPFYVFVVATISSIAIGNYATTLWRRGDRVKMASRAEERSEEEQAAAPDAQCSPDSQWRTWRYVALPSFAVVLLCTGLAYSFDCLEYRLGGLAPLMTAPTRAISLDDLRAIDPLCGVVVVMTLLVAPCLYTLCYPRFQFLASWCAGDVLLLACVASLLQLNQFVQFVTGDKLEGLYSSNAVLLWPLLPLLVSSLVVWALALAHLCHWDLAAAPASLFRRCCCAGTSGAEETQPLMEGAGEDTDDAVHMPPNASGSGCV